MANVFGIITAIALALSAFIAMKNKTALEATTVETASQKDLLTGVEARLKAANETLTALPSERATIDTEADGLVAPEAAQKKANDELTAAGAGVTAKIAENKAKLDEIRTKTEKTGDLKELGAKMRTINAELEELNQSIAGGEAKLANLTAMTNSATAQASKLKTSFEMFAKGDSLPSLNTRIRSIYPNWGFVTLGAGNNGGVVANSTLNVVRGGEVVAKLLVTSVESRTASASIIPDSLSADAILRVGDRVVPGTK